MLLGSLFSIMLEIRPKTSNVLMGALPVNQISIWTFLRMVPRVQCTYRIVLFCRLCRLKKKAQAEANATAISNLLPFMEYEVHTQLMNKLKLKGMNALFGLRVQITVGENMLMGLAVSRKVISSGWRALCGTTRWGSASQSPRTGVRGSDQGIKACLGYKRVSKQKEKT